MMERRLLRLLVLALANQGGQIEQWLTHHAVSGPGILQDHRGFLEHALLGQCVRATRIGIGKAFGPFRPPVLPGQLLENLHRFLKAAYSQRLSAPVGQDFHRSRRKSSAPIAAFSSSQLPVWQR